MHLHLDDDENFGAGEAKVNASIEDHTIPLPSGARSVSDCIYVQAYEQWKLNINDFFPMRRAIVLEDQKKEEEGIDKLHVSCLNHARPPWLPGD